jgi:hypothetical protein
MPMPTSEEVFYIKFNREYGSTICYMYLCKPYPTTNMGAVGIYTDYVKNNFIKNWNPSDLRYQFSLYKQTQNGTLNALTKTGMICSKFRDAGWTGSSQTANRQSRLSVCRHPLVLCRGCLPCQRSAPTEEAMEKVNMIHRRAYGHPSTKASSIDYSLSDYSTEEAFINLILKERGYETVFEGKRYLDLKRCGKLAEAALNAGRISSLSDVGDAAYWWPIPSDEFNYNTALDPTTDQNPGY